MSVNGSGDGQIPEEMVATLNKTVSFLLNKVGITFSVCSDLIKAVQSKHDVYLFEQLYNNSCIMSTADAF